MNNIRAGVLGDMTAAGGADGVKLDRVAGIVQFQCLPVIGFGLLRHMR